MVIYNLEWFSNKKEMTYSSLKRWRIPFVTSTKGFPEIKFIWSGEVQAAAPVISPGEELTTWLEFTNDVSSELVLENECDLLVLWLDNNGDVLSAAFV